MADTTLTSLLLSALFFACSGEDAVRTSSTPLNATASDPANITEPDDVLVARGKYLVDSVAACADCHTPRGPMGAPLTDQYLAGAECFIRLDNGSCLNTPNLTDHATGLRNRTDEEIKRMIVDGMRPTAAGEEPLFPVMGSYVLHNLTERDISAIVAYLRTVPGVDHAVPRRGPEFDVPGTPPDQEVFPPRAGGRRGARGPAVPLDPSVVPEPKPGYPEREAALRGRYLATQACLVCHSGHIDPDPQWLDYGKLFAGGEEFDVGLPTYAYAGNITSDPETGIGDWSLEDIVAAMTHGTDTGGDGLCPPMPVGDTAAFGRMTDEDMLDIAHFIKSLPPIVDATSHACPFPPM